MPSKNNQVVTSTQARALYGLHGPMARDLAASMLGGDPFEAERVAQRVFRSFIGTKVSELTAEKLSLEIADKVVDACLEASGNEAAADPNHLDGDYEEIDEDTLDDEETDEECTEGYADELPRRAPLRVPMKELVPLPQKFLPSRVQKSLATRQARASLALAESQPKEHAPKPAAPANDVTLRPEPKP